jgi:hypothetical protein
MMRIVFRNMERSQLAIQVISERLQAVFDKFERLEPSDVTVTLTMDNSPSQAGPDLFCLRFYCRRGEFKGLVIEKVSPNLYIGLADLVDTLAERLGRFSERRRRHSITANRELGEESLKRELFGEPESASASG